MAKKTTLGGRLRAARDRKGMSLGELAEASGVSKATLSRVERDERSLSLELAAALCDALGLTLDALAGREPNADADRRPSLTRLRRLAAELDEGLRRLG